MIKALLVSQSDDAVTSSLADFDEADLPEGDTLIEVLATSINYKDAMAIAGRPGIIKEYPLIPGIDLSGTVLESENSEFPPGSAVTVNGWGLGEDRHGGFAERSRVPSKWLVHLPAGLSPEQAAAFGTAGYTAALAVLALADSVHPSSGEIIVTGAGGGVGGFSLGLLRALGYTTVAATSRVENADYLMSLGADRVISLEELTGGGSRPLQKSLWAGGVDALGGTALASILAQSQSGAAVTATGLAESPKLDTSVLPFILRGVSLLGINSVYEPMEKRARAWNFLALNAELLENLQLQTVSLEQSIPLSEQVLAGRVRGRILVDPRLS